MVSQKKSSQRYTATYVLFGIFVLLAIFVALFERPWSDSKISAEEKVKPALPLFDTTAVQKIELKKTSSDVVLTKQDSSWFVSSKNNAPADATAIEGILNSIPTLTDSTLSSQNPDKQDALGVTENSGLLVALYKTNDESILKLFIGNRGPTFDSWYFRVDGSNDVFLVDKSTRSNFDKAELRDLTIISINKNQIVALSLKGKNGKIALTMENAVWKITEPFTSDADSSQVVPLLEALSPLKGLSFVEDENALKDIDLENSDKVMKVWFQDNAGLAKTLYFIEANDNTVYAKLSDKLEVYSVGVSTRDIFSPDFESLKKKEGLAPEQINAPSEP